MRRRSTAAITVIARPSLNHTQQSLEQFSAKHYLLPGSYPSYRHKKTCESDDLRYASSRMLLFPMATTVGLSIMCTSIRTNYFE